MKIACDNMIQKVDHSSNIPLFGLDFLGILDRGTNVLEVKPITVCNLHCKYCFVSSGDYHHNFYADSDYLLEWVKKAIAIKEASNIEIHLAPYGEILMYPPLYDLLKGLKQIPEISTISAQCNGMLLSPERIANLEECGLDRLNISLNSMDTPQCQYLCDSSSYNVEHLLNMFDLVLQSKMDLLIAPVWFMKVNDQGVEDIIEYVVQKQQQGYEWPKLRLGIQNYLTYKTGRKLNKVKMREFSYFYSRLREYEQKTDLKLRLGPGDFGIEKTKMIQPPIGMNEVEKVQIIQSGRWDNEYIARLNEDWAVKVLSKAPLQPLEIISVQFIRSNLSGNLLTAIPHQ